MLICILAMGVVPDLRQPYSVHPTTLETKGYDPFEQIKAKTFTAHPKVDPFSDELVVYGYEAKGLGSTDIVTYTIDRVGKIQNEFWFKQPYDTPGLIHDCAIVGGFAAVHYTSHLKLTYSYLSRLQTG